MLLIFGLFCYMIFASMIKLKVYAKINLALNVLSFEQGGYHQLDMVNQSVGLFDEIRIVPRPDEKISVYCDKDIGVINTAWSSANEFTKTFKTNGYDITIKKGIPMKGGLGGSSADAAGVLVALAKYHDIPIEKVYPIAEKVGSDVKYMMTGGLARVGGKGEEVCSYNCDQQIYFVVVMPDFGLSTGKVFECFDKNPDFVFANCNLLVDAMQKGDLSQIRANLRNGLQQTAFDIEPRLKQIFDDVGKFGKTCMTGSGSCLFLVEDNQNDANDICKKIKNLGYNCIVTQSRGSGVEFLEVNSK